MIEAIKDHGYDNAVQMTDDEFLYQLQAGVTKKFYDYLKTGTLTSEETTFQMALAMAKGKVENKFKQMHRNITGVVGFVNILDVYKYLGAANITIQNQFGFQYLKDFMGFNTIFLLSDSEIPADTVIATPVENIVMYYIDPNDSDFAKAGLVYTTSGETNLIGFQHRRVGGVCDHRPCAVRGIPGCHCEDYRKRGGLMAASTPLNTDGEPLSGETRRKSKR